MNTENKSKFSLKQIFSGKKLKLILIPAICLLLAIAVSVTVLLIFKDNSTVVSSSEQSNSSSSASAPSFQLMWGDKPLSEVVASSKDSSSDDASSKNSSNPSSSDISSSSKENNLSQMPTVTVSTQVGDGVCVVAGYCSKNTEKITISGTNVTKTETVPFAGKDKKYFITQVRYTAATNLNVTAKEKNKTVSEPSTAYVGYSWMSENYMYAGEYTPVIGKNGQMHFYSALLSYSLNANKLSNNMDSIAYMNISQIVESANSVGAETIFLVIPSSADIYPETVPSDFKKASGERLYERFSKIATDCGAKVIYPLNTMKKHSNDGVGYQLYQHTDSHWSTYGAYWGTYDLLQHISKSFPKAKPRTLSEMGFYTAEMHGGDALFNFPRYIGFENNPSEGVTNVTGIKELTTLYSLKMPTSTLKRVYHNNNGLYLTEDNAYAATENNPNGSGLPTALIMRDSFGKVSYDMLNDRFKTVYWGEFNNYNLPIDMIESEKLDYVIYLYSERNLLKIMMNSSDASVLNLK